MSSIRDMTHYLGDRTIDGIQVTADDEPLDPRFDLRTFSVNGFEWTYEGEESRQLALALLCHHLGDDERALRLVDSFMTAVVANFDNTWEMSSGDLDEVVAAIENR